MKRFLLSMLIATVAAGCSGAKNEVVAIDDIPKNLLEIAKEKLPDVTFDQAVRKSNGILEIRGKDKKGKVRDVEFNPQGEVVEVE